MIFYNNLENISDKFKLIIKNKTQSYTINFTIGSFYDCNLCTNLWSFYASDISKIIDDKLKKNLIIYQKKKNIFKL